MKLKRSKFGEFVPVIDQNKVYYGGFQDSLKHKGVAKFYRDRSCVVTAFTNCYLYMYRPGEKFSIEEFNDYQYRLYKILRPKVYGIPSGKVLDFKLNKLRKDYYMKLKPHYMRETILERKSLKEKANFIKEALAKDCPLILFNRASPSISLMRHHGVTVTEIEEKDGDYILTVSSWGRVYKLSLEKFSKQFRTYTGFLYFEREDK